jgi:hypothetical protein
MPMTRKPTTSYRSPKKRQELRCIDSRSAAYAEMAANSDREAEAEQWLEGLSLGHLLDEA